MKRACIPICKCGRRIGKLEFIVLFGGVAALGPHFYEGSEASLNTIA